MVLVDVVVVLLIIGDDGVWGLWAMVVGKGINHYIIRFNPNFVSCSAGAAFDKERCRGAVP